jgi:hypothetical protein
MRKGAVLGVVLGFLCVFAFSLSAEEKKAAKAPAAAMKPTHVIMSEGDLKWGDAPPSFPAGAKMVVLQGDPGKPGMFTIRLKVPDGYKVAAHWHPTTENLTVISGTFNLGTGDKLDEKSTTAMTAGAFGSMPAKMHHYAWTKGATEVQVSAMGPFKLIYVNPADDPSKAKK